MYFEVWEVTTANLLLEFDTREEALEFVRDLAQASPPDRPANLALGRVDEQQDSAFTWIARGDDLVAFLATSRTGAVPR